MAGQVISKIIAGDSSKNLIASSFYGVCTTAATTTAKPVIIVDPDIVTAITPVPGTLLTVKFTNSNTIASPTLTLYNNSGSTTTPTQGSTTLLAAKAIHQVSGTTAGTNVKTSWRAGAVVPFVYDGTNWVEASSIDANDNTTYTSVTLGNGYATLTTTTPAQVAKAASLTNYALVAGGRVSVYCQYANTTPAPTMNINTRGDKAIYINNAASSASNPALWDAGDILEMVYDGTQYQIVSKSATNAEIDAILSS